jgi:SSS family solute:Na+ symporter
MLIGGFFLYLSYYGCDQSQAQRMLTTRTFQKAQKALLINGLLRFPLVLTYCAVGVLLLFFLHAHPEFAAQMEGRQPDFLVPAFLTQYIPKGMLGFLIAGIFAASMSSLDSALNSLSAATYRDFLVKIFPRLDGAKDSTKVLLSRLLTVFWGAVATGFALEMIGGSETVLELVNKIGSAFYGPILAVFWLGMFVRRAGEKGAIAGLMAGVGVNIFFWLVFGERVSWLWWNVIGFAASFGLGAALSLVSSKVPGKEVRPFIITGKDLREFAGNKKYYALLVIVFLLVLILSRIIERILA